jgi:hypothetical protein
MVLCFSKKELVGKVWVCGIVDLSSSRIKELVLTCKCVILKRQKKSNSPFSETHLLEALFIS